jgi:hypothetical protein
LLSGAAIEVGWSSRLLLQGGALELRCGRLEAAISEGGIDQLTEIHSQCTPTVNAHPHFYYFTTFKIQQNS